jgi:hypothetical protein
MLVPAVWPGDRQWPQGPDECAPAVPARHKLQFPPDSPGEGSAAAGEAAPGDPWPDVAHTLVIWQTWAWRFPTFMCLREVRGLEMCLCTFSSFIVTVGWIKPTAPAVPLPAMEPLPLTCVCKHA